MFGASYIPFFIEVILRKLFVKDILNFGQANKEFNKIAKHSLLWKMKSKIEFNEHYEMLLSIPNINWFAEYKKIYLESYQYLPTHTKILRLLTAAKQGDNYSIHTLLHSKYKNINSGLKNKDENKYIAIDYLNISPYRIVSDLALAVAIQLNWPHNFNISEQQIKAMECQKILDHFYRLYQSQYGKQLKRLAKKHGDPATIATIYNQPIETIQKLLGPNPTIATLNILLYIASFYGHAALIRQLILMGANPNNTDQSQSVICAATYRGNWNAVEELLKHGSILPDLDHINPNHRFVYYIVKYAKLNLENLLLYFNSKHVDINTLLHIAAEYGNLSLTRILLLKGSNTTTQNNLIAPKKNSNIRKFIDLTTDEILEPTSPISPRKKQKSRDDEKENENTPQNRLV